MNTEITNYIGYSASLFIVLSFILKDVRKIRVVNMIGCFVLSFMVSLMEFFGRLLYRTGLFVSFKSII